MKTICLISLLWVVTSAEAAVREGYVDIMPKAKAEQYKRELPHVDNPELDALMRSPDTMWYDSESIVPGYQDSKGDPIGFRPNTIDHSLIDLAVPGGHAFLFSKKGRFNFPFATGGADNSDNLFKVNFWAPGKDGNRTLPVVYWKLTKLPHWSWMFPKGTVIGEVLYVVFPDGHKRVFEIRTRTRQLDKWTVEIYRPFLTALDLADEIKRRRVDWFFDANLKQVIDHLTNDSNLIPRTLQAKSFEKSFESSSGHVDIIPDFGDPKLVDDLLSQTVFQNVGSTLWKSDGNHRTYAASTASAASIVPKNYDAGLLKVDDQSCTRCHSHAGRLIGDFWFDLVLYGEIWGEDQTFSWHPFETSKFVDSEGNVLNFNNDNRRFRPDFTQAGLIQPFSATVHTSSFYKELERSYTYW